MIPVHLLTGFLGAGKTTLLNRMIEGHSDTALVVNEFGTVAIDTHLLPPTLLRQGREAPVATSTGCLCCTRGADLRGSLADLLHARQQGQIPDFARVIVETTGMADPAPIINSLIPGGVPAMALRDHAVARAFRLVGVITVVDAGLPPAMLERHPEILRQIALADHLVLSHTDQAPAGAWPDRLHAINPGARLDEAADPDFDPQALLDGTGYGGEGRAEALAGWLVAESEDRHAGITALALTGGPARLPGDWQRRLQDLAARPGILRIKGLLAQPGTGPLIAHAVGHRAYPLRPLDRWPPGMLPETRAVVIGSALDAPGLRHAFLEP